MSTTEPLRTLAEHAHARIRDDILTGALAPDTKLRIEDLRRVYDVGASPLREALNRLAAEGLVIALSQRGFRVAPISVAELRDLTRVRVLLEGEALAESIRNGDQAWEAGVRASHRRLAKLEHGRRRQPLAWEQANEAFHAALIAGCRSPLLLAYRRNVYDKHRRYRALALELSTPQRPVAAEHRELLEAALARDVGRACAATEAHMRRTAEEIERGLAQRGGDGAQSLPA